MLGLGLTEREDHGCQLDCDGRTEEWRKWLRNGTAKRGGILRGFLQRWARWSRFSSEGTPLERYMKTTDPLTPDALVAHGAFVLSLARGLTRDESSALDLRQDAMVTALQSPPRDRSVRGWFSAVLRSRKVEKERSDAARRRREDAVAMPEASAHDSAAPLEELELNHSVVRAVLDLQEPYRSVVVDVYFEGLTPEQVARRRGAKASTVRSQLSRAHDQLRGKLDRKYRERNLWAVPLVRLLEVESAAGVAGGGALFTFGAWSTLALAAAVAIVGGVLFVFLGPEARVPQSDLDGYTAQNEAPDRFVEQPVESLITAPPARADSRQPIAVSPSGKVSAKSLTPELEELPALLTRVRALRTLILQRAMTVDPETLERFAWIGDEGGVVRLLNRERYGTNWSTPWMRGGGGFYSFLQRSRNSRDRMQVSLIGDRLYLEAFESLALALGKTDLASVPTVPVWSGDALGQDDAIKFDVAWSDRRKDLPGLGRGQRFVELEVGSTYLLRSAEEDRMDLLVAFEVLTLDEEGCTLAWRLLKQWPTEVTMTLDGDRPESKITASVSQDLIALAERSDEQLRAELDVAIETAQRALFDFHGAEIEETYGSLRDEEGCGLARLVMLEGAFSEFKDGEGHGAEISPLTGSHGARHAYLGYRGDDAESGELTPSLSGTVGMVCDLGAVPLDEVTLANLPTRVAAPGREKASIAFDRWFGFPPPRPGSRELQSYWAGVRVELSSRLGKSRLRPHAAAKEGHTYLVRSVETLESNLLFTVHMVAIDPYGVIVTWRILDDVDARSNR